jgi:Heterokaryon incompatibility protein (HET)
VRFLCIDALCIIQDSPEDWLAESEKMKDVYSNSYCSIAASWSDPGHGGLFYHRNQKSVNPPRIKIHWENNKDYLIIARELWNDCIVKAPLSRRAWVLQETLLAPHVLYFGREQIFWECQGKVACETYPTGMPSAVDHDGFKNKCARLMTRGQPLRFTADTQRLWYKIIEVYSQCSATKPLDKLIALSGIAQRFEQVMQDRYLAGLWEKNLGIQLVWRVNSASATSRSSLYRAPSWSWACLDGNLDCSYICARPPVQHSLIDIRETRMTSSQGFL